jgi:cytochrome b561
MDRVGARVAHVLLYGLILLPPILGWLHECAFKDAATHPLHAFWIIPWFRVAVIQDLPSAPLCPVRPGRSAYCGSAEAPVD